MSGIRYIPADDEGLIDIVEKVYHHADSHHMDWGVIGVSEEKKKRLTELRQKIKQCRSSRCSITDIRVKNDMKKTVEKDIREYVQGYIAKNPLVTVEDRTIMELPVYKTKRTPVGIPQGQATANVKYLGGQVLQLHIEHVSGTPFDKKANYGYKIFYGVFADGDPQPVTGEDLHKDKFTRRKKEQFMFSPTDVKKTAYFCIRYENSKGQAGTWGPMIKAIIP